MIAVAMVSEVPNFGKKIVTVSGREVLLINSKGTVYAFENECPHQGAPMGGAVVKDTYLACPRHGYRFNLHDGRCNEHPEYTLATYPVTIEGDQIFIELS